jgi:hypothetical protein
MDSVKYRFEGGTGTLGLLGIVFVTLKLCSVIDWSWWWVLAPFWVPITVLLAAIMVVGLAYVIVFGLCKN